MRYDAEVLHLGQRPFDFAETGPIPQFSLAYSLIVIRTVSTGASNAVLTDFATRRMSSAFCASLRPVIIFIETIGIEPALLVRHMEVRSEEHTSELQSLMRISYAVFCL